MKKTAFERSREEAQRKADREAAETAAAYEEFVAEYGDGETNTAHKGKSSYGHIIPRKRNVAPLHQNLPANNKRVHTNQKTRPGPLSSFDLGESDEEAEGTEQRQAKLKSGSNFLSELKQQNTLNKSRIPAKSVHARPPTSFTAKIDSPEHSRKHQPDISSQRAIVPPLPEADLSAQNETMDECEDESGDDMDYYRARPLSRTADGPLNKIHRAHFKYLLDSSGPTRGSVARMTAFAMTHASSVSEISETLCQRIAEDGQDWKAAVGRLWCISDILHNSWAPIANVWKYRQAFEDRIEGVMKTLKDIGNQIESRIRQENFRRLVIGVLDVWNSWICFAGGVMEMIYETFDDRKPQVTVKMEEEKKARKSGGWRKIDSSVPSISEVEAGSGKAHDLDGEEIDLDGETIDLDGEPINLDQEDVDSKTSDAMLKADSVSSPTLPSGEGSIAVTDSAADRPRQPDELKDTQTLETTAKHLESCSELVSKDVVSARKADAPQADTNFSTAYAVGHDIMMATSGSQNKMTSSSMTSMEPLTQEVVDTRGITKPLVVDKQNGRSRPVRRSAADYMD